MKDKTIGLKAALKHVRDGDVVAIGGFLNNGNPFKLTKALAEAGIKDLTLISNDTGFTDSEGIGELVQNQQFSKIITSHIGTNKETGRQMNEGITVVQLTPQGTIAEQLRAGAFGLGGFLTPTGIGTQVAEGKEVHEVDGTEYLLEYPLKADVALVFADKADKYGNLTYTGSENNFNHIMAANAKTTIVEARNVVEAGEIDQNAVVTPGIYVDYIVNGGE